MVQKKLYLYNIADDYIKYLSRFDHRVSDAKIGNRNHKRKYIGVLFEIDGMKYFAPLSSPKPKDFNPDGSVRDDPFWLTRIVTTNKDGEMECKGKVTYSGMIPVHESAIEKYNLNDEPDSAYRKLLIKEIDFVTKHREEIYHKATTIYRQKMMEREYKIAPRYLENVVDFALLEEKCLAYKKLSIFKPKYIVRLKPRVQNQTLGNPADLTSVEPDPVLITTMEPEPVVVPSEKRY